MDCKHTQRPLSVAELCRRWGVCRSTIYNMFDEGELSSFKVRGRRLIPAFDIERVERGEAA